MRRIPLWLGCAAAIMAGPALAQQAGDCSGFKWPVERETKAFAASTLPAIGTGTVLPGLSQAATLNLARQDGVVFAVSPSHRPKHDPAYAGVFPLPRITSAGAYQVTASDEAWIDVVQDGKVLKQTGFTGSHTCGTVRKSVKFDLVEGDAVIEISDAAKETLKLDVEPAMK